MIYDKNNIDCTDTMYPCAAFLHDVSQENDQGLTYTNEYSTTYGFVLSGEVYLPNGMVAKSGQHFCVWTWGSDEIRYTGKVALFVRIGFKGQDTVGGPLESIGRLCYIDGCSDSLLVYPPRLGDPTLNVLFFPPNINQSYHIHPSLRLGVVVKGKGWACIKNPDGSEKEIPLTEGIIFCIEEKELHRFRTEQESMIVVPFHPDGDWGPTDHNHVMINRTYLNERK